MIYDSYEENSDSILTLFAIWFPIKIIKNIIDDVR